MGSRLAAVMALCALASCVHDELVACGDGRLCPVGTACDLVHATCVTPAQTTVCVQLADGDRCDASGFAGICDGGVCVAGCGDARRDVGEECDDGNFASHDGCSSTCLRELASWTQWKSPWSPRQEHVGAAYAQGGQVVTVVLGGTDSTALLDDEWHRAADGTWSQFTGSRPPARRSAAIAYDSFRQKVVMFGGEDAFGTKSDETWELDATGWTKRAPSMSPPPRSSTRLAYDATRKRIVMFGGSGVSGLLGDTWEYDGTTWAKITVPMPAPAVRSSFAMTWDAARQRTVMFGGGAGLFSLNDTWEYNGTAWTQIPGAGPSVRSGAAFVYSSTLGRSVLFGGTIGVVTYADTWLYGASGWTQITTGARTPPARAFASFTEDGNKLVLIGGAGGSSEPLDDVWELSNSAWAEAPTNFAPYARSSKMVYDSLTQRATLVSGLGVSLDADAWQFDGVTWAHGPAPAVQRFDHAVAYDDAAQRLVVFGGHDTSFFSTPHTLFCDSASGAWSQLPLSAPSPSARSLAAMTYDRTTQRPILFGGDDDTGAELSDTWELVGDTWEPITAPGPSGQRFPALTFDEEASRAVLVSGTGETWTYKDRSWAKLSLAHSPPPRDGAMLAYDTARHSIVMFGGEAAAKYGDVWELADDWQPIDLVGAAPAPRSRGGFAYDRRAHAFVLFGGVNETGYFGDTWTLGYNSATPDEDCSNAIDDDGDQQVDAADPDCN